MPGRVFRTSMCHDTGSSALTIFPDEVVLLYNRPAPLLPFTRQPILTSLGVIIRPCFPIEMRIISTDHTEVVSDWQKVTAFVAPLFPESKRLSPRVLEQTLFTCMTPSAGNLYVAVNKTQLFALIPAN